MPEFNLIKLEGKPFEKLIDVISKGIGTLYSPRAIRKEADAKSYEIGIIESAKRKAIAEGKESEAETYIRIKERLLFKEIDRQNNLDNVIEIAAEQLSQEKFIKEEPVDKDWSKRFFNIVEDVSDEEMQTVWGRILAGEIKLPKSYSMRTLELLKNLSKEEAESFMRFSQAKVITNDKHFIYNQDKGALLEQEFEIKFSDILLMKELRLITTESNLILAFESSEKKKQIVLKYGSKGILVSRNGNVPKQELNVLMYTKTGIELSRLISQELSIPYLEKICSILSHENVNIQYGDLMENSNIGQISLTNIVEFKKQ